MDMYREYRFRSKFGGSHKDFLDQPVMTTEWLVQIDNVVQEVTNG